jgi:hypothetical protein
MDLLQSKYEMKFETLKIDTQDIALLETISDQDIKEISEKIFNKTNLYLNNLKSSKINDEELNEIIEIFFHEIVESIDYVYNLIISKQLGG